MKKILSIGFFVLLLASCAKKDNASGKGYITIDVNTIASANITKVTGVPEEYDAKTLCVEIIDAFGRVVKKTNDVNNDAEFKEAIPLDPGNYTIEVHSANWNGSDSAFDAPFYAGSANANVVDKVHSTVKVTCTLQNVKVSVIFDSSFTKNFLAAKATIESAIPEVSPRVFKMGEEMVPAYFPAGDLELTLNVANKKNETYSLSKKFTEIRPRDHIIVTFKVADSGTLGGMNIIIDETHNNFSFKVEVPMKSSISIDIDNANAWGTFAILGGAINSKTDEFNYDYLSLKWKKADDAEWTEVENSNLSIDSNDVISYKLRNLSPETDYQYKISYMDNENEVETDVVSFRTGKTEQIYNGGFENWYKNGKIEIAGESGGSQYWDSSNAGAATYIGSVTTKATDNPHGGSAYANLATQYAVIKLAAASLFTGKFIDLIGTKGAKLEWGVPFTSRPTSLKGYMMYNAGEVNRGGNTAPVASAPAKGQKDHCQIFCALTTELFKVANASNDNGYEMSTEIDWENDPRVVAFGELTWNDTVSNWTEFEIPIIYHNTEKIPTHMIIVCSSSKYGDYFYGSDKSVMKLDDFSFVYNDAPKFK